MDAAGLPDGELRAADRSDSNGAARHVVGAKGSGPICGADARCTWKTSAALGIAPEIDEVDCTIRSGDGVGLKPLFGTRSVRMVAPCVTAQNQR
jgi:hypothetical protein